MMGSHSPQICRRLGEAIVSAVAGREFNNLLLDLSKPLLNRGAVIGYIVAAIGITHARIFIEIFHSLLYN